MTIRASSAIGRSSKWQVAADEAIAGCVDLGVRPDLGFLYISDYLCADAERIRTRVVQRTGVRALGGTVGVGICGTGEEVMDQPAVSLLLASAPEARVRELRVDARAPAPAEVDGAVAIVHADPTHGEALMDEAGVLGTAFRIGGLTSSRVQSLQMDSRGMLATGCVALTLDAGIQPFAGVSQGIAPIGPVHRITGCLHNLVATLDGRPALDVLIEDLDLSPEAARDDAALRQAASGLLVGVQLPNRDHEDTLVRNLLGFDRGQGVLALGHIPGPGELIRFVRRDAHSARRDLRSHLETLQARTQRSASAALYFSCVARGQNLFEEPGAELELIQEVLGPVPLAGFFGQGEISGDQIYGYTGVLLLLA